MTEPIDPAIAEALREGRPFCTWRLISVLNHQFRELLDEFHNNVLQPHLDWLEGVKKGWRTLGDVQE